MLLEITPFLLCCPICWHIIIHSILLWFFVSLWYWLLFLLFHFFFGLFMPPFSPWWCWLEVYQFCLSFQKSTSQIRWYFYFLSYLFSLWSLLFLSFCWLQALPIFLFLIALAGLLGFWVFPCFGGLACISKHGLSWRTFYVHLKRMWILLSLDGMSCR